MTTSGPSLTPISRMLAAISTAGMLLLISLALSAPTTTSPVVWIGSFALWIGPAVGVLFAERKKRGER